MSDWMEIDRQLAKEAQCGYEAFINGKTKYENPHDPGSLNFDMWASGYNEAKDLTAKTT